MPIIFCFVTYINHEFDIMSIDTLQTTQVAGVQEPKPFVGAISVLQVIYDSPPTGLTRTNLQIYVWHKALNENFVFGGTFSKILMLLHS